MKADLLKLNEHITSMTAHIQESLATDTFASLTVTGPNKKRVAKQDADDTRGCLRLLTGRLIEAPKKQLKGKKGRSTKKEQPEQSEQQQDPLLMMQITLKYHGATDIVKNWELDAVPANLETLLVLGLSNYNDDDKDKDDSSVWTDAASEWGHESMRSHAPGTPLGIQKVTLETIPTTFTLDMGVLGVDGGPAHHSRSSKLSRKNNTAATADTTPSSSSSSSSTESPTDNRILAHDRTKQVPLSNQADFLQQLGVTDSAGTGKPKQGMTSKLRQCQKFVEIVGRLVERCCLDDLNVNVNDSSAVLDREISVVDMGCGRGYLTFSLHSFLQNKYGTTAGHDEVDDDNDGDESSNNHRYRIRSRGIDVRPKLVQEISEIAQSLGTPFADSLTFEEGNIADFLSAGNEQEGPKSSSTSSLDVLIALHACDTATDDALWSGIARQANVIVVAPCCHKQVRSQLDVHARKNPQHPLADVLRHNIYRERLAETATDSIRALLLEIAGYNVQVFEFIGGEHTSKNVMITAVKQNEDRVQRSEKELLALRKRLQDLASLHGVRDQKLAEWMGEILQEESNSSEAPPVPVSARNMPPL
jgi:hypothetical protein